MIHNITLSFTLQRNPLLKDKVVEGLTSNYHFMIFINLQILFTWVAALEVYTSDLFEPPVRMAVASVSWQFLNWLVLSVLTTHWGKEFHWFTRSEKKFLWISMSDIYFWRFCSVTVLVDHSLVSFKTLKVKL